MERSNIEKIAQSAEDRLLLAKLWDKMNAGMRKNIPAATCFLSPRELEMAKYLFGEQEGLYAFGGYGDAERKQKKLSKAEWSVQKRKHRAWTSTIMS